MSSSRRIGFYAFTVLAAALVVSSVPGHSQAFWQPTNITAVDRGVFPLPKAEGDTPSAHRRRLRPGDKRARNGAPYRAGRVLVRFKDGTSGATKSSAMSQVSRTASMAARPAGGNFDIMNLDANEDAETAASGLAARPDVEFAQPDYRVYPYAADTFVPNDQYYASEQWNFPAIDMEHAWAIQPGGSPSIIVAVVDTGMAFANGTLSRHAYQFCSTNETAATCAGTSGTVYPDLGDLNLPVARAPDLATSDARFVSPYDFVWNTTLPVDLDGHGTHVAGTLGELTNNGVGLAGVAFNVKLMPVKVLDSDWDDIFHSPAQGTDSTVAQGIQWAADHGANVINLSLGRTGAAGSSPVVEAAVKYAVGKGAFVVIAGGNNFLDGNDVEVLAEIASRVKGAVSVAAVDRKGNHASYSTSGSYIELAAPGGDGPDYIYQQTLALDDFVDTFERKPSAYVAPRFDIMAYYGFQGTSMATPHVSGVAALLMSQGVKDPAAVEVALETFATDRGAVGRDDLFGFGEINARNTLRGLGLAR